MKSLIRSLLPSSLRAAVYEARQRPWKAEASQWCADWATDRSVHRRQFQEAFGKKGDFEHPVTFSEKLHWMSLHYRQPIQTQCADKYAVRQFVTDRGLGAILNMLYGVWDSAGDVPLETLPGPWVMKVNHGSGQNIFHRDATRPPWAGPIRRQLAQWMKRSEYWHSREWAYKNIQPKIICEALLSDENGQVPPDYKIFCFGGVPKFLEVDSDRFTDHRCNLFDLDWKPLPFSLGYPPSDKPMLRPEALNEMLDHARVLSAGFPFVRVDFYATGGRVIFGEMTWYPGGGLAKFTPEKYDRQCGEMIDLPKGT